MAAQATREIARFDAEIDARFAPSASLLLRSESSASSEIEKLSANAKAIIMAEAGDTSRRSANVIASNTAAMNAALDLADDPSADAIIEMHRALLESSNPRIPESSVIGVTSRCGSAVDGLHHMTPCSSLRTTAKSRPR